jgi:hypothetical protein
MARYLLQGSDTSHLLNIFLLTELDGQKKVKIIFLHPRMARTVIGARRLRRRKVDAVLGWPFRCGIAGDRSGAMTASLA